MDNFGLFKKEVDFVNSFFAPKQEQKVLVEDKAVKEPEPNNGFSELLESLNDISMEAEKLDVQMCALQEQMDVQVIYSLIDSTIDKIYACAHRCGVILGDKESLRVAVRSAGNSVDDGVDVNSFLNLFYHESKQDVFKKELYSILMELSVVLKKYKDRFPGLNVKAIMQSLAMVKMEEAHLESKEELQESVDAGQFLEELNEKVYGGKLKLPIDVRYVSNARAGHLGKAVLKVERNRETGEVKTQMWIEILKRTLPDDHLHKSILAHESIHIYQYQNMTPKEQTLFARGYADFAGHGSTFTVWMDKMNEVYGEKFVDVKGTYSEKTPPRTFKVLLRKQQNGSGKVYAATFVKMTPKIRQAIERYYARYPGEVKVVSSNADFLTQAPIVSQGVATFVGEEINKKLSDMFDTMPDELKMQDGKIIEDAVGQTKSVIDDEDSTFIYVEVPNDEEKTEAEVKEASLSELSAGFSMEDSSCEESKLSDINSDNKEEENVSCQTKKNNEKRFSHGLREKGKNPSFSPKDKKNMTESLRWLKAMHLLNQQSLLRHLHKSLSGHESYPAFRDYLKNPNLDKLEPLYSPSYEDGDDVFARARVDNSSVRLIFKCSVWDYQLFVLGMKVFDYDNGDTYENIKDEIDNGTAVFMEKKNPPLNKPMRGDVKKYRVYVKDPDTGNIKKVNFGDPNMEIKRDDPKRRKSFRARHKCDTAKDKTTPRYWSCKFWSKKPVSKMLENEIEEVKAYHGTSRDFEKLKPNKDGIIWLTPDKDIAKRYQHYYDKGMPKIIEVDIKDNAVFMDLRDINNPIAQKYKEQYEIDQSGMHGLGWKISDSSWPRYATYATLERLGIGIAKEDGIDVIIVNDNEGAQNHVSFAVINKNIINSQKISESIQESLNIKPIQWSYPSEKELEGQSDSVIVYHGSKKGLDSLSVSKTASKVFGQALYFTDNYKSAMEYGKQRYGDDFAVYKVEIHPNNVTHDPKEFRSKEEFDTLIYKLPGGEMNYAVKNDEQVLSMKEIGDDLEEVKAYHGTDRVFKQFDPSAKTRNANVYGRGSYFTTSPNVASDYAGDSEGANVHVVDLDTDRGQGFWDVTDYEGYKHISEMLGYPPKEKDKERNWFAVLEKELRNDPKYDDAVFNPESGYSDFLAEKLKKLLYTGVMIPKRISTGIEQSDIYVVYDEKAIKPFYRSESLASMAESLELVETDISGTTWYHGGEKKYDSLIPGDGVDGVGIYLTKNKSRAEVYSKRGKDGKERETSYVHEVHVNIDPSKVWYNDENVDLRNYTDADWLKDLIQKHGESVAIKDGRNAKIYLGWENEDLVKRGFQAILSNEDLIVLDPSLIVRLEDRGQNLLETVQSDREIRWLAELILEAFIKKIEKRIGEKDTVKDGAWYQGNRYRPVTSDKVDISKFKNAHDWVEIGDFVFLSGLTLGIGATDKKYNGVYKPDHSGESPLIHLNSMANGTDFKKTLDIFYKEFDDNGNKDLPLLLARMKQQFLETLVHELTHAWDDFRSGGKFKRADYTNNPEDEKYWLSQIEINARFAGTSSDLSDVKMRLDDGTEGRGFDYFLETFKENVRGWESMPEWVKKRLIGRLYKEYMDISNNEKDQIFLYKAHANLQNDYLGTSLSNLVDVSKDERFKSDKAYSKNQEHTIVSFLNDALRSPSSYKKNKRGVLWILTGISEYVRAHPDKYYDIKEKYKFPDDYEKKLKEIEDLMLLGESKNILNTLIESDNSSDIEERGDPWNMYQSKKSLSRCQMRNLQNDSSNQYLEIQKSISGKSEKKNMIESLQSYATGLVWNTENWSRLVHEYFKGKENSESTRRLFLQFAEEADLSKIEPLKEPADKARLFRVRLNDSKHRIILRGEILYSQLWIYRVAFFNYDDHKSYYKFLKAVDNDEIEFHEVVESEKIKGKDMKEEWRLHATSPSLEGMLKLIQTRLYQPSAELVPAGENVWHVKNSLSEFGLPVLPGKRVVKKKDRYRYEMRDATPEEQEALKEAMRKSREKPFKGWAESSLREDSWASEVGAIRSELGELEEIYKDFNHIYSRLNHNYDIVDMKEIDRLMRQLMKAFDMVKKAEEGFREITKSPKAPARTPIKHSTPSLDAKTELERMSTDVAKLSVRVRNVGQASDEFENVEVSQVAETFEAASEVLRKMFVKIEKLIP